MSFSLRAAGLAIIALALACGDSGSGGTGGSGGSGGSGAAGGSGATGGSGGATSMCIQPGDLGNPNGVGHYCTPGGGECGDFPLAPLCLADVGQDEWFCTRIGCDEMTDCGTDAGCLIEDAGSACVPCACDAAGIGCGAGGSGAAGGSGGAGG